MIVIHIQICRVLILNAQVLVENLPIPSVVCIVERPVLELDVTGSSQHVLEINM